MLNQNNLHRVRVTATVEFDVTRNLPLPELVEYARNEMWIRLQQGSNTAKQIEIKIIE